MNAMPSAVLDVTAARWPHGYDVHSDGSAVWVLCRDCNANVAEDWSLPSDLGWLTSMADRHECGADHD